MNTHCLHFNYVKSTEIIIKITEQLYPNVQRPEEQKSRLCVYMGHLPSANFHFVLIYFESRSEQFSFVL